MGQTFSRRRSTPLFDRHSRDDNRTDEVWYEGKWYKNGDHPADYAEPVDGFENGELTEFSPAFQRENDWEGQVVRRYRRPGVSGTIKCGRCGYRLHDHGWIDQGENGVTVCPGSEIVKVNGLWFTYMAP